ncbi:ketopantoate reductase family protein [Streptomyces sp. NPDC127066]|uniref:ketopantoate reductase family protein n=1 Tax=Streptomyces sp. NPDC127066 TaxID=3347125 RepID=UPI003664B008
MHTTKLTVAIVGPGGVGGLIGALLARDGHRVICLAREETAAVLRQDGLRIESTRYGDFTAAVEADTQLREKVDAVFVTVKQTALEETLDRVPAQALGDAIVVPLLNGLEHVTVLRERYPSAEVVAGTIRSERRPELLAVLDEITAVAQAAGTPVTTGTVLSFFDRAPHTMKSSMQRDAAAGRPLELDAIGGAVLRAGAAHEIETPATALLVAEATRPVNQEA